MKTDTVRVTTEAPPDYSSFPPFDVVPESKDHHFFGKKPKDCFKDGYNPVHISIMREWRILSKNLPESIFVRVYETRIDLLRAVIIGSPGTPYHDGLFFFDISLPYDYPNSAPQVYYHSHGYRLNPNLYANGTLCLSLIGTWWGTRNEKWTQTSTLLQLLISIQGLVLNSRPYFNEPGYASHADSKSSEWINNSLNYNEDAFILSCMTMIQVLRNPPKHFEAFVEDHFRSRAAAILSAVKCYKGGHCVAGEYYQKGGTRLKRSVMRNKFKSELETIEGKLESAFGCARGEIGGDIEVGIVAETIVQHKKNKFDPLDCYCLLSVLVLVMFLFSLTILMFRYV